MKVREIITFEGWTDGSGWNYSETYEDDIVDIDDINKEPDWSWYELEEDDQPGETDTRITIDYYPADCDDIYDVEPLKTWRKWASDLYEEQCAED